MQRIDFEHEELLISEAVCLSLHSFDFVVGSFQRTCRDSIVVVGEDSGPMGPERFCKPFEHGDTRRLGSCDPVCQVSLCRIFVRLLPQEPEILFHVVCRCQRLVDTKRLLKSFTLISIGIKTLRIFQEKPSSAFENIPFEQIHGLSVQITSQVGKFIVVILDDMEVVEHYCCLWQTRAHSIDIGGRHVDRHGLDSGSGGSQSLPK